MNAERLHAVARRIRGEIDALSVLQNLDNLLAGLQGLANSPSDPASQQRLSEARTALQTTLTTAPSNGWPSSDRQLVDELGLSDLLGEALLNRIEAVLSKNDMTPAVAANEITPIVEALRTDQAHLIALTDALSHFEIGADEPPDDAAEIVLTIPREAVDEDLRELGKEFTELARILRPFQELTTGSRGAIPVESISSSAFGLELLAIPAFAYGVARAVNEILTVYKNVLDIRNARQQLKDSGVPDEALAGVDNFANDAIGDRNETLAQELVEELPVASNLDESRRNELTIELRLSLNALANRIDRGYDIDVRAPEPPPVDADDEHENGGGLPAEELESQEFQRQIRELSRHLRSDRPSGASILSLPEQT